MQLQTQRETDKITEILEGLSQERVNLERVQPVAHNEYHQTIGSIKTDYRVTVTERDEKYHLQIRDTEEVLADEYIDSESPYEELPQTDKELYRTVKENLG